MPTDNAPYVNNLLKASQNYFALFFDLEATRAVPRAAAPITPNTATVAVFGVIGAAALGTALVASKSKKSAK